MSAPVTRLSRLVTAIQALVLASPIARTCEKVLLWSTFVSPPASPVWTLNCVLLRAAVREWNNIWSYVFWHPKCACKSCSHVAPTALRVCSCWMSPAFLSVWCYLQLSPLLPGDFLEISMNFYVETVPRQGLSDPTAQGQNIWGWEKQGREADAQSKGQRASLLPGLPPLRRLGDCCFSGACT